MSYFAGVFYSDGRPVAPEDRRHAGELPGRGPVQQFEAPGLVLVSRNSAAAMEGSGLAQSAGGSAGLWDGRLDNRDEVRATLGDAGVPLRTDGELALRLYETKGAAGLRSLVGDWSLAIWDARSRGLVLASDYAGIRPLYYRHSPDSLIFSSSLRHIVRWTGAPLLDEEYAADFLSTGFVRGRTPYRGVQPAVAGSALTFSAQRAQATRFWDLPFTGEVHFTHEPDYEQQLHALFQEAVAVRLDTPAPVCAELSGGMDSSTVVCMAHRLIDSQVVKAPALSTISYCYSGSTDEKFIRTVEEACGSATPVHVNAEQHFLIRPDCVGGSAPLFWAPRLAEVARHLEETGTSVFLTGQTGDLIMGNWPDDSEQVADLLRKGRVRDALTNAFGWSQALKVPIYPILWRAMKALAGAAPEARPTGADSLTPRFRQRFIERMEFRARPWPPGTPHSRRKRLRALADTFEARTLQCPEPLQDYSCTQPFIHRPLVEFMMKIPPRLVCGPSEPRRLMRRAFSSLLPDRVLRRRSKGSYDALFLQSMRPCAMELLDPAQPMLVADAGFVERPSLLNRLQQLVNGVECNEPQLRRVILLEIWLRRQSGPHVGWRNG